MKNKVIIQASANSFGNTHKIINFLNSDNSFDVIDLKTKNIGCFEYDFSNANDDFLPLMEHIIKNYDTIVFATPVYWYSMSGILKDFFDRMSDLLHFKKELGRKLRGKNMAMISNSGENDLRNGFEMPFVESAKYLGMNYKGNIHTWFNGDEIATEAKDKISAFRKLI
ncbi:NAD(P)H-dependent oxidoreductase [Polaribacter sp. Z022]|uniref:flavodoxin family protein n=1 Tax=Polaribacter sp. Z022 TaxID=2927125 RepID=UPI002021FA2B|nr:NAD(P)H-dependent oxidoreductase [Polaribacter sp. Z022]MCL7754646.1 NAD(P)H-dependent oxidoreductase [Polaribacter sp. Z022]